MKKLDFEFSNRSCVGRATGHAFRSNFTLRAHIHFYRCRGSNEDENTVNQHDSVFP